jgi:toxin ParE1/3/4
VNLRVLAAAETEGFEARDYFDRQAPDLGGRFVDDLAQTLAAVAQQPLRFPRIESLPDDQPYRRALLSVFRYAVIFEILADEILVVAIGHSSRKPNYWLRRRKAQG